MLRLRTFGGLTLSRGDENLTGAITQRRRLAILALLAVAGDSGMSRDRLVAFLWPESDAERARHVLNQLLYAQRRQVAGAGLFLGRKTLRLNPAEIATDVGEFEDAVTRGDLASAAGFYAGAFLDGFFLKDAPEFEQWVASQRRRWERRAMDAFAGLAGAAAATGDVGGSVAWWRRAAELDPLDSEVAVSLARSLADAGDRPGALRHARRHVEALTEQLGVPPDARVSALIAELSGSKPAG